MSSVVRQRERQMEPETEASVMPRVLCAIALFGISALLFYIVFAAPQQATAMAAIQNCLRGLGGYLRWAIPLFPAWAGTLCVFSIRGKHLSWWRITLNAFVILLLFSAVHMFSTEKIVLERMTISGYANFVSKSYLAGIGGGALGAIAGWPLYKYLGGCWGGFFACLLLIALCLTATGRMSKMVRWSRSHAQQTQNRLDQRRNERTVERLFEPEDTLLETAFERPDRERREKRPVHPVDAPVRSATRETRQSPPRRGRLYNEKVAAGTPAQEAARQAEEAPADVPVEAEASAADAAFQNNPAARMKKTRQPKAAEKPEKPAKAEEDAGFTVDESLYPEAARHKEPVVEDDEFRIEPEQYEAEDEPPFDVPEAPKQKPMPKLKRMEAVPEIEEEEYNYPPIDLLNPGDEKSAQNNRQADMEKAKLLEETLRSFGIETKLTGIAHGPVVTRYELQPAPGVKVSRITSLSDDIALNLAAESVRIEAPIPGKAAVGVEIPNEERETVSLREVLESPEARKHPSKIAIGLGKDNSGRFIVADIAKMPHVLIAGQTGSGKSVCINSLIISILFRATPDEVKLILIDPKVVELSVYNGIPHLIAPVVTDPKKAASALDWAVNEMSQRYKRFAEHGVRDIKGYNKKLPAGEKPMPQMVIVIDELADLMMVAPGDVEDSICRLAQLARAAGMHLVIATQRPSVNVITGIIKANIPTRIAFSVASQIDSRTMIDHGGAEKLLGRGDMLFVPSGMKPIRVQGVWVSDDEVENVVEYIKERSEPIYDEDMVEHMNSAVMSDAEKEEASEEYDARLPEAVEIVVEAGQASISMLQRRMRVGYARAGRLIDEMAQRGIVSEADGAKPRTVLVTREQFQRMFEDEPTQE